MDYGNDSNTSVSMEDGGRNITTENDVNYGDSSVVPNPHPATATPDIPSEVPVREGKPTK